MKVHSTIAIVTPGPGQSLQARTVLDRLCSTEIFNQDLPPFCVCAAVLADEDALPTGATGKVLKRTLRENFWSLHGKYVAGDRSTFTDLRWNAP